MSHSSIECSLFYTAVFIDAIHKSPSDDTRNNSFLGNKMETHVTHVYIYMWSFRYTGTDQ